MSLLPKKQVSLCCFSRFSGLFHPLPYSCLLSAGPQMPFAAQKSSIHPAKTVKWMLLYLQVQIAVSNRFRRSAAHRQRSLPFGANLSDAQHGVQLGPPFAQGQGQGRPGLFTAVPRSDCKTGHSPRPPRRTGGTHGQPGLPRFQALHLPLPPLRSRPLPPLRGRSHRQPSAR